MGIIQGAIVIQMADNIIVVIKITDFDSPILALLNLHILFERELKVQ
jgi:hypothetical protein